MPNLHIVWLHVTANNLQILNLAQQYFIDGSTSAAIIEHKNDERYQLEAKVLFIIINNSTCFGHLYAHLQEYKLYTTAYDVQY